MEKLLYRLLKKFEKKGIIWDGDKKSQEDIYLWLKKKKLKEWL